MRRRNTSKAAAAAASVNARAAIAAQRNSSDAGNNRAQNNSVNKNDRKEGLNSREISRINTNLKWSRSLLVVVTTSLSLAFLLIFFPPSKHYPSSLSITAPDVLPNLSLLPDYINITSSDISAAFDDFFAAMVQPLLDRGLNAFNGTRHVTEEEMRVGYQLHHYGRTLNDDDRVGSSANRSYAATKKAKAKHPVVMIPGFVTSGLELWQGEHCAKKHFRQRLWGSASMARTFLTDRECWRKHLSLHPITGMDPPNVRLRSAQGFEAADNFIATFWVWSKLIENLADVGYDGSMMTMMSYDWRLAYELAEKRDGYFTKFKHTVEAYYETTGEKVVLVSHSMGTTVVYYFLQWVVKDLKFGGGGGGKDWVEEHIEAFVNIAGTLLGVPKAIPALLSGELKDTAVLFAQLGEVLEQYFGRRLRRNLWNTWGSLFGMLPKGGDAIWGVGADILGREDHAKEDIKNLTGFVEMIPSFSSTLLSSSPITWNNGTDYFCQDSSSPLTNSTEQSLNTTNVEEFIYSTFQIPPTKTWSMQQTIDYLFQNGGGYGPSLSSSSLYSFDAKRGWKKRSKDNRKHWHDPIAAPLPRAPSLKIYCMYGVGIPTERTYHYKVACDKLLDCHSRIDANITSSRANIVNHQAEEPNTQFNERTPCAASSAPVHDKIFEPLEAPFHIDTTVQNQQLNINNGISFSDGDASVPLISLGYMCQKWQEPKSKHNPSRVKVFTREHNHKEMLSFSDPGRGGPSSGEHVDILGNVGVIEDVVRIATGFEVEEKVNENVIVSDLKRIMKVIDDHPMGGLKNAVR